MQLGGVTINPIPSRHIGKTEPGLSHCSYMIEGSKRIFFAGDAALLQWKGREVKLDVLIAPYAYANTPAAWAWSQSVADQVVLLHLPARDNDPAGLWEQVYQAVGTEAKSNLFIPQIGESYTL